MTDLTVVIPAHNEEAVISGAVEPLAGALIDTLVVANGCTDRTADRARAGGARVMETADASKIHALNVGLDMVSVFPVAFVDADVTVSPVDLRSLAARLEADPLADVASPKMHVLPSTSWWVRQYYRAWELTDYRSVGHIGSGVYLLSAAGVARLGRFPDVIADDLFVQRLFAPHERLTPTDLIFSVHAPGSISALLSRNTRIAAGNLQLARGYPELAPPTGGAGAKSLVKRIILRPSRWVGFAVYSIIYLRVHRRARALLRAQKPVEWSRDESTRRGPA
jgi:glycosyltransferase involved in cell wall biosynthesis